jgi:hypothetical protein
MGIDIGRGPACHLLGPLFWPDTGPPVSRHDRFTGIHIPYNHYQTNIELDFESAVDGDTDGERVVAPFVHGLSTPTVFPDMSHPWTLGSVSRNEKDISDSKVSIYTVNIDSRCDI